MRDMSRKNAQGVAKSQGFAFVNFTKHEHALEAIRKTNNNPAIFGDKKVCPFYLMSLFTISQLFK